jgi:hypothetical protein
MRFTFANTRALVSDRGVISNAHRSKVGSKGVHGCS